MLTRIPVLGLLTLVATASPASAVVWHIYPDGSGDAETIQEGLDLSAPGDIVLVAPGTYYENLTMTDGRILVSEEGPDVTIIDGSQTGSVIHCSDLGVGTRISGFTLQNGRASFGGGVHCVDSEILLEGNIIRWNSTESGGYGGGVYAGSCGPQNQIHRNVIHDNDGYIGGGICCNGADRTVVRENTIAHNTCTHAGGIISYNGSEIMITRNIIVCNVGQYGGGVYVHSSSTATISCNDVWSNVPNNYAAQDWTGQAGNISVDPLFCNDAERDFGLAGDSPCLPGNHPDGVLCGLIGALGVGCDQPGLTVYPLILEVSDVGNDQGRQVRLVWRRSLFDAPGGDVQITSYGIYRRQDEYLARARERIPRDILMAPRIEGWDYLLSVPARGDTVYQTVVPTLCDSTAGEGICWSVFMVSAMTPDPLVFFDSPPDSGYSVDNLAPGPPGHFSWNPPTLLTWDESEAEDFAYFTVYGSEIPQFGGEIVVIVQTTETEVELSEDLYPYYFLTASDLAGNEGEPAFLQTPAGLPGGEQIARTRLLPCRPNPFRESVRVGFELRDAGHVLLAVYDGAGRLVCRLLNRPMTPGRHEVWWVGRDDAGRSVSGGVYFVRLMADGRTDAERILRLR